VTHNDIQGWFNFQAAYDEAAKRFGSGIMVEVGAWLGKSTAYLAAKVPRLFVVDTWKGSCGTDEKSDRDMAGTLARNGGDIFLCFLYNMRKCGVITNIVPLRMLSVEAAEFFKDESISFCFIDGAHDYHSVLTDISVWMKKIRRGGVIAGHDYDNSWPDVIRAVDDILGKSFSLKGNVWWREC
jgi:hypothetical protein